MVNLNVLDTVGQHYSNITNGTIGSIAGWFRLAPAKLNLERLKETLI